MRSPIRLSDHFTGPRLLRFVLPSVIMMVFTSIYGMVDGLFVSNLVGKTAFTAVNLIFPFIMIMGAFGFMIGAGGSALTAAAMGEGDEKRAKQYFSMLTLVTACAGALLAVLGILFASPIAGLLGAEGALRDDCVLYGRIILAALPAFMLQNLFQSFLVTAERPKLGLSVTVAAGVGNMVFDALFVGGFGWGLAGAAAATALSQCIGGLLPLLYFFLPPKGRFGNHSRLRLVKPKMPLRAFVKTCTNGSSELLTNISLSLVSILYNRRLLVYAGEDGVAAYGVILYVGFLFISIFLGYAVGSAPIVSYNYGARCREELRGVYLRSIGFSAIGGAVLTVFSLLLAVPGARIFVGYDGVLLDMTVRGFLFYAPSFLFAGINIYASSFFTALGCGGISALLSFFRTLFFQVVCVLVLPIPFGLDGIWVSVTAAEFLSFGLSAFFLLGKRKKYGYGRIRSVSGE